MRSNAFFCTIVLLSFLTLKVTAEEKGAKAIFQSGEGPTVMASSSSDIKEKAKTNVAKTNSTQHTVQKYMGISYWIERLDRAGEKKRVPITTTFRSGDRIKLSIETNQNGYLYVINVGSTGQSHVLFPNSSVDNNLVTAWVPYEIPYSTYMRFDENPGEETLLVMLSPKPIGDAPLGMPAQGHLNNQETQYYTQLAQANLAKDIVLEDEPTGFKPAGYVVAPMSSLKTGMITLQIKLRHK